MANIERYIMFEVIKPLVSVLGIMVGLFACFSSARYLSEGVTETLGIVLMMKLVFLKTIIALEVLVPVALYVSVFVGLGRLHRDQEIIALRASGVSGRRIITAVLKMVIPIGIIVGILSIVGRPWAYESSYLLDARAEADLNTNRFQEGRFYGNEESGRVIYINEKDQSSGEMENVFHFTDVNGASEVILAHHANQTRSESSDREQINLYDGMLYRLAHNDDQEEIIRFTKLVKYLDNPEETIGYKRKAATTPALMLSEERPDIAELQWRLSRPFATILLALIAVPLSRSSPRQGKNEKVFTAALVFAVYYNLSGLAKTWVEQGVVEKFPGVWWLQALMLLVVIIFLAPEFRKRFASWK